MNGIQVFAASAQINLVLYSLSRCLLLSHSLSLSCLLYHLILHSITCNSTPFTTCATKSYEINQNEKYYARAKRKWKWKFARAKCQNQSDKFVSFCLGPKIHWQCECRVFVSWTNTNTCYGHMHSRMRLLLLSQLSNGQATIESYHRTKMSTPAKCLFGRTVVAT